MKLDKFHKTVKQQVVFHVASSVAKIFYFAGLTALIPLIPLLLSPSQLVEAKYAFGFAIGLIFVGFLLVYWFSHSNKLALRSLGLMTLIPGLLAVLFSYMGPRRQANLLRSFGEASPFLEEWIRTYVPKAWLLAGIYIIIGVILIWLSERVRK